MNLSISIGGSKSSSQTTQTSDTAAASNLTAGRDINIAATGDGANSDLTLQGSKATAARNLTLTADDEIRLLAAANTAGQKSTNKNSSGSVGISFGTDACFNVGASAGRGKADGDDLTMDQYPGRGRRNPHPQDRRRHYAKGAVAKGEQVIADIGTRSQDRKPAGHQHLRQQAEEPGGSISIGYWR
ncbi:MAG: hemagglutinin repeat-containing protein [Betaproteobacteria bacterium]|nr:hemagglutinin repeat-containing protein [Betaproteobacteria bacterium]